MQRGDNLRFGVLDSPNALYPTLMSRWRLIEELGFDNLWAPDHTAAYSNPEAGLWFDGWVTLAAMVATTSTIRVGTLVSNPILRHPAILAKQAAAVDHLSGGRLELGLGTGIAAFDHAAVGVAPWSAQERTARFSEYVRIVDAVLRSGGSPVSVDGQYYSTVGTRLIPDPPQRPRPPITIGGQSAAVLRVAAAYADSWNSDGHPNHDADKVFEATRRQNATLDEYCVSAGREPSSLRRSLLLIHALDAWSSPDAIERFVEKFWPLGIREYVMFWPGDDRRGEIEKAASEVIPRLRRDLQL